MRGPFPGLLGTWFVVEPDCRGTNELLQDKSKLGVQIQSLRQVQNKLSVSWPLLRFRSTLFFLKGPFQEEEHCLCLRASFVSISALVFVVLYSERTVALPPL